MTSAMGRASGGVPGSVDELLPLAEVRSELTVIARGTLALLDRQADLFRMRSRYGGQFPELVGRVHDELVAQGYRQMVTWSGGGCDRAIARLAMSTPSPPSPSARVHDRQDLALYGVAPAGAGEGAVVRVWVDVWATWLDGPF